MIYNFDEIVNRKGTGSIKWDFGDHLIEAGFTEQFNEETLSLFTADMDFAVPPCITEALHKVVDQRIFGYTMALPEYYEAIISWFSRRHNWTIKEEEIIYAPGTVYAIGVAVRAYTRPGEGIIIQRPVYFPFTSVVEENGRIVANNQMLLDDEGYYRPNLQEFEDLAKDSSNTMFILCNPHNPSGRIFDDSDLCEMARICKKNNVTLVADEIHGDLIRKTSKFTPIAKLVEDTSNIVTCTAINKTFNTAGLHATNMVIQDKKLRKLFNKELGHMMPSPFSCGAVIAAYNEGEAWLEALKIYLDETIDWVMDFCVEHLPKMRCVRPEGTYIMWMDFRDYGLSADQVHKKIYIDANVLLEGGKIFDPDLGDGFERICLSSPRAMVQEAFVRIAKEFKGL